MRRKDGDDDLVGDMLHLAEALYVLFPFLIFICGFFFVYLFYPHFFYSRTLSQAELVKMSAQEYVDVMRQTSVMAIPDSVVGWPKPDDIPYLLSVSESKEYSGSMIDEHAGLVVYFTYSYGSSVGVTAVILIKAIKEGTLRPYMTNHYPPDKDEIIAWARGEAAKMKSENFGE